MLFPYQKRTGASNRFEGIPSVTEWQNLTNIKTLFFTHRRDNPLLHGIDHALGLYEKIGGYFQSGEVGRRSVNRLSAGRTASFGRSGSEENHRPLLQQRNALQASVLGAVFDACNAWLGSKEQVTRSNRRDVVLRLAANSRAAYSMVIGDMYEWLGHAPLDSHLADTFGNAESLIDRSNNDLAISCLGNLRSIINRISCDFEPTKPVLAELSRRLHSEILTRLTPSIQELYRNGENVDFVPVSIKGKYGISKIISEDLIKLFDEQSLSLSTSSLAYNEAWLESAMRGMFFPLSDLNRRKLDNPRLGGSDTLNGKSGGGETTNGKARARANWKKAENFVAELAKRTEVITINDLQEINRLLNDGMPNNGGRPGEFRLMDETAGGGNRYPGPEFVPFLTEDLIRWVNDSSGRLRPLELAAVAYQRLVSIHPFSDGNGRTGRLFADLILERGGLLPAVYDGNDVLVAIFAQPQPDTEIVKTEAVIQRVFRAVMRSAQLLSNH